MLRAALRSAGSACPHEIEEKVAWPGLLRLSMHPQHEQVLLVWLARHEARHASQSCFIRNKLMELAE
jgi:hypothetical protein